MIRDFVVSMDPSLKTFSELWEESTQRLRVMQNILKMAFARQWSYDSAYQRILLRTADIQDGKRLGSTHVILDDEFSISSRQLWVFAGHRWR